MRIKNLKYDPLHADKPMRAWSHLEFLDRVMTIEQAKATIAYERKMRFPATIELVENKKKKANKKEAPDLKLESTTTKLNDSEA